MIIFNYSLTENTKLNTIQVTHPKKGFIGNFNTIDSAVHYCIANR